MIDLSAWHGRDDVPTEGPSAVRWHQHVKPYAQKAEPGFVLVGFPSDEGVKRNQGRIGAASAPPVIRQALAPLAWHATLPLYDAGDLPDTPWLEQNQSALGSEIARLIVEQHRPIILGGGHETAWGTFQGIQPLYASRQVGIINLDAHFDLRPGEQATSGTPFAQMARWCLQQAKHFHYLCLGVAEAANTQALFEVARAYQVEWLTDEQLTQPSFDEPLRKLHQFIDQVDCIYLSIDLDVLPASVMPAVSAPSGWGVPLERVARLLGTVAQSGKLIVADMVEYNPSLDPQRLAVRTAARLIWHLVRQWRHA